MTPSCSPPPLTDAEIIADVRGWNETFVKSYTDEYLVAAFRFLLRNAVYERTPGFYGHLMFLLQRPDSAWWKGDRPSLAGRQGMMVPTIHLNGTARADLIQQCLDAMAGIDAAIMAMGVARPHGRDYYPQGDGALVQAEDEHEARIERLRAVRQEMEDLARAIVAGA